MVGVGFFYIWQKCSKENTMDMCFLGKFYPKKLTLWKYLIMLKLSLTFTVLASWKAHF